MITIKNAAPRAILNGIKDESGRAPVYQPEARPTHMPHVFLFAQRGPLVPQVVVGDSLVSTYGAESFDYRSKYATHQTVLINTVNGRGNMMVAQRVVAEDAAIAALVLWADYVADDVPDFQRADNGRFLLDAEGKRIPTGQTVPGIRVRYEISGLEADQDLHTLVPRVGTLVAESDGTQSTMVPLHAWRVSSHGSFGDLVGIRLSSPTIDSSSPVNDELIETARAYMYRLAMVERPSINSLPVVKETLYGDQFIDFTYKPGVINTKTDTEVSVDDILLQSWNQEASNGLPPTIGLINDQHVYFDNIEDLLTKIQENESLHGLVSESVDDLHMVNFIGGHDYNGTPYYSLVIEGPSAGGILLNENSTHYALGGSDGTMDFETFDRLVGDICANYGEGEYHFLDSAVYPQSIIWDSGFSLETKKKLLTVLGRRKDIAVILSTQDVSQPQNSNSEESSIAVSLRTAARMFPESEIYGTSVCRAMVVGHSGYLVNSKWKQLTPLTIELADKCAAYMGAGDGVWKSRAKFDISPANQVTMFRGVNSTYKKANVRSNDWDAGLVWVQNFDRRSQFFPGLQTVYDDDTSILNSMFNMLIAVELEKVAEITWRQLTGISGLTENQFITRSNRLIEEAVKGRFDNRVVIVPDTFVSEADQQRGFSWGCNIVMYGNNMKTVGSFTIVARRREDLEQ